jgi:hypothetical protein
MQPTRGNCAANFPVAVRPPLVADAELWQDKTMTLDDNKIDRAVLALLHLGIHEGARAWKSFDWDAMARLHEKGFISDPRGQSKSVAFTETGEAEARKLLEELFSKDK